jgi:hypothetical protein
MLYRLPRQASPGGLKSYPVCRIAERTDSVRISYARVATGTRFGPIPTNKINRRAGALAAGPLKEIDQALRLWLELRALRFSGETKSIT